MNPLVPQTASLMALSEGLKTASHMVREIAQYKQAIAELEVQRLHMHEQAKIVHAQIKAHHKKEVKRIEQLSAAYKSFLKQNKKFIALQQQQQNQIYEQCMKIYDLVKQETDIELKKTLMSMWQDMFKQLSANREETSRLQQSLTAAFHQFGIDLASPGLELKDVF